MDLHLDYRKLTWVRSTEFCYSESRVLNISAYIVYYSTSAGSHALQQRATISLNVMYWCCVEVDNDDIMKLVPKP
jgi:hypothetical protein